LFYLLKFLDIGVSTYDIPILNNFGISMSPVRQRLTKRFATHMPAAKAATKTKASCPPDKREAKAGPGQ
jgi:hypothetical protein